MFHRFWCCIFYFSLIYWICLIYHGALSGIHWREVFILIIFNSTNVSSIILPSRNSWIILSSLQQQWYWEPMLMKRFFNFESINVKRFPLRFPLLIILHTFMRRNLRTVEHYFYYEINKHDERLLSTLLCILLYFQLSRNLVLIL